MHRSRKSIATLAAALAGVLGMAGVAAAAHGSSAKNASETIHHQRGRHGVPPAGATSTTARVTTTSEAEHAQPEPGDDNGIDPVGHEAGEHAAVTPAPAARAAVHAEPADDRGDDAGDDNGVEPTSTTLAGATTTSSIPDETTTTVASIPNGPQTLTVAGGTVTIDVEGGVLSLVSVTPNSGFVVDKSEARADRVEVEFRSENVQSRVRVRIDDGRLRVETGGH